MAGSPSTTAGRGTTGRPPPRSSSPARRPPLCPASAPGVYCLGRQRSVLPSGEADFMPAVHLPPADIQLDPSDWYLANWRNLPALPRPSPAVFDLADCCKRLARVKARLSVWDWSAAQIGPCLGPDEGRFWLEAFARAASPDMTPARLAEELPALWP